MKIPTNPRFHDLTGYEFGRLTVREYVGKNATGKHHLWKCDCSCGGVSVSSSSNLKSENTFSCGCWRKETAKQNCIARVTHGMYKTPEYRAWAALNSRCYNPHDPAYKDYGARGIKVSKPFRESFQLFFDEVGPRPTPEHTIERIKNGKGYVSGNIKWATYTEQNRNKRNNFLVTWKGDTKTTPEWSEIVGIPSATLRARLDRGWSVDTAMTKQVRNHMGSEGLEGVPNSS